LVVYTSLRFVFLVPAVKHLTCEEMCLTSATKATYMDIKTTYLNKLITKLVNPRIHEAQLFAEDRKCLRNRSFEIQHNHSKLKICSLKLWKHLFAIGTTKNWNEVGQKIRKVDLCKFVFLFRPKDVISPKLYELLKLNNES
jgi:hypothetical protein